MDSRRRLTTVGGKQLEVDNHEDEEKEDVFPTRRSLRGDFFSNNGGDMEEGMDMEEDMDMEQDVDKADDPMKFIDTLDTANNLRPCPWKYCASYQKGPCPFGTFSNPYGSTCATCTSCSRPGYRGYWGPTNEKMDFSKRRKSMDTLGTNGCPAELCIKWRIPYNKVSGGKGKAYCAICAV